MGMRTVAAICLRLKAWAKQLESERRLAERVWIINYGREVILAFPDAHKMCYTVCVHA